jgi:N-acetylglucosaminyldiphosphoundecaprenol N-acetyl-beta-D-mannosaminyltransferase
MQGTLALRRRILNVDVHCLDQAQAIGEILEWCDSGTSGVVVTPNLDHVLKLESHAGFRAAYERARMVLADGAPLVWASRLIGTPVPHVPGSDLIQPLCAAAAARGHSVFLLGTTLDALAKAARRLVRDNPGLVIAGVYSPPFGFEKSPAELALIDEVINVARPNIVLAALGAPKQEIWASTAIDRIDANAVLCIGAGLDFIAGSLKRAPRAVRAAGLEWLWRALSEPRRLGRRYLKILLHVPVLAWKYRIFRGQELAAERAP